MDVFDYNPKSKLLSERLYSAEGIMCHNIYVLTRTVQTQQLQHGIVLYV